MKNNKAIEIMERMESLIEEMRNLNKMFEELINKEEIEQPTPYEEENYDEDLDSFELLSDEDLEGLLDEEYIKAMQEKEEEEYQKRVNSPAHRIVLLLRDEGLIVNHEDMEEFIEDAFDDKDLYLYTDEEIIDKYNSWLLWREF